jgi:hypothetical protein
MPAQKITNLSLQRKTARPGAALQRRGAAE